MTTLNIILHQEHIYRVWGGRNPKNEPDGVFSIGKKAISKILIHENQILAACSDGYLRIWNLHQSLASLDQPIQA